MNASSFRTYSIHTTFIPPAAPLQPGCAQSMFLICAFGLLLSIAPLCAEDYTRITADYLDSEMIPVADKEFFEELYEEDSKFAVWTKVYKAQVDFTNEAPLETKSLKEYSLIAMNISKEINDLLNIKYEKILSNITNIRSPSARTYMEQTYDNFRHLRYKMSDREFVLQEVLKVAKAVNELSQGDADEIREKFPSFRIFWEDAQTKILVEKRKFCSVTCIYREMVDESKYIVKNGFKPPMEILKVRIGNGTTAMCHSQSFHVVFNTTDVPNLLC